MVFYRRLSCFYRIFLVTLQVEVKLYKNVTKNLLI